MSQIDTVELDPDDVAVWTAYPFDALLSLSATEVEGAQLGAVARRFESLRSGIAALDALATRQGVDRIDSLEQAATVLFDHRVYKSYPMSIIEKREFERLTTWLRRLTTHDVTAFPMDGVRSIDDWLEHLDAHGMIMSHSTGTTGKLSFMPRSRSEWQAWQGSFFRALEASCGVDFRVEAVPLFYPGYRSGNTTGTKMQRIFSELSAAGEEGRYCLYDYAVSSDLLSLAARMRTAEERGELDQLDIDPQLLEERKKLIEVGRRREQDLEQWFTTLADEFRGRRVRINGVAADLVRLALKGRERGIQCEFAPGSVMFTSGGLKGFKDAPSDWEQILKDFFGIDRLSSFYGMTESMGYAPRCAAGFYHFFPFTVPMLLDADGSVLPREGAQTGRFAFVDLLAESYWGGFITSDRVTLRWDDDCECGWRSPRIEPEIVRFSELEGGDDKITCAGSDEMYSEFMDYVSNV